MAYALEDAYLYINTRRYARKNYYLTVLSGRQVHYNPLSNALNGPQEHTLTKGLSANRNFCGPNSTTPLRGEMR